MLPLNHGMVGGGEGTSGVGWTFQPPTLLHYSMLSWSMGDFWTKFCVCPHCTWHDCFSDPTGCVGHGLASSESRHEPIERAVLKAWAAVRQRRVMTLVGSMPRLVRALLAA